MGCLRYTIYRYQELAQDGVVKVLIDRSKRKPNVKNRVDEPIEKAVLDYAINQLAHEQHRTNN